MVKPKTLRLVGRTWNLTYFTNPNLEGNASHSLFHPFSLIMGVLVKKMYTHKHRLFMDHESKIWEVVIVMKY
jgi:hypothetical protein